MRSQLRTQKFRRKIIFPPLQNKSAKKPTISMFLEDILTCCFNAIQWVLNFKKGNRSLSNSNCPHFPNVPTNGCYTERLEFSPHRPPACNSNRQ